MSTSVQQVPLSTTIVERRFYPRIVPQAPLFVAFNECEESLLLNVSENGLLVSTPTGLTPNFVARLSLLLKDLPKPVQVTVRVLWTSEAGNLAGIQLLDLSEHDRQQIRKWGAREAARSSYSNSSDPLLIVPSSPAPDESARAARALAEDAPHCAPPDFVPLAPPLIVRQQSTSIVERCVIWGLYLAAACLVIVFLLRKEALGRLLSHSRNDLTQTSAALPIPQKALLPIQSPNTSQQGAAIAPASPAPTVDAATFKSAPSKAVSAHHDFAMRVEALGEATSEGNPADAQSDLSQTAALPAPSEAALGSSSDSPQSSAQTEIPKEAVPEPQTPASLDSPTPTQPLPNPARASDASSPASATIPPNTSTSSIVASARPSLSSNSDATVIRPIIQMDPPRNQTLEVHLPSGHQASFLSLPGERVIESPTATMHIQRSVLVPASGGGWFANRNKKVVIGELISRVDPQAAQTPTASAASVRVKATVTKDGRIENVRLILGPANLAPSVANALREWRYQPTLVDNKPVETQCYVVFQFHAPSYHAAKR
ncbi:MAG TPA: PilZ domain-containing protein [Candidatus Acidoferrum sp.]|nr:PilZ domain-containing protein [Candidatus Acidoferrum sp.]